MTAFRPDGSACPANEAAAVGYIYIVTAERPEWQGRCTGTGWVVGSVTADEGRVGGGEGRGVSRRRG